MLRLFVLAVLATALAACPGRSTPTTLDAPSEDGHLRIISLAPNVTEIIAAIGATELLVGRSSHCNYPPEVLDIPSVGSGLEPDPEQLIGLQPTLIVATEMQSALPALQRMRDAGVEILIVDDVELDDIPRAIRALGGRLSRVAEAEAVAMTWDLRIAEVRRLTATTPTPRVLAAIGHDPLYAAGPDSRIGELIDAAGATNALDEGDWVLVDDETLLRAQPEIVIDSSGVPEAWLRHPSLPAVRDRRICEVDGDRLARPGPRLVDALVDIVRCVHPDVELTPLALGEPPTAEGEGTMGATAGGEAAAATSDTIDPDDELVIATWNIEWLHVRDDHGPNPRLPADYERLAAIVDAVAADVWVLQEVQGVDAAARVFDPDEWTLTAADQGIPQLVVIAWREGIEGTVHGTVESLDVGGVREGLDVTVRWSDHALRILGVHLKSGCWGDPLDTDSNACRKLAQQLPAIEAWIDARADEPTPFAVVGDFNRRLSADDPFWIELDDGEPANADLTLTSEGRSQQCWGGRYPDYIDHIVLDARAAAWWPRHAFSEYTFDPAWAEFEDVLSDHCPIQILLQPR